MSASAWPILGRTANAAFRLAHPRVIVVEPDDGCTDDEVTARESIALQQQHWREQGHRGAAVVLMDRVTHQTKGARRVYQREVDAELIGGFALVGSTAFGRAVASVFVGLSRPAVPTRMYGSVEEALEWAAGLHGGG